MTIAVALGTLLLGGWVLDASPELDESTTAESMQQQPAEAAQQPRRPGMAGSQAGGQTGQSRKRAAAGVQPPRMQTMPMAPTDSGGGMASGQPTAPTGDIGPGSPGFGSTTPMAPTTSRMGSSDSGFRPTSHSTLGAMGQLRGAQMPTGTASFMTPPSAMPDKAFSGYRPPSGVSPYMNLFRRGDDLGTIDNYTSLVRPELEQRYMNQRLGNDIRGLQNSTRMQGMNLQHLNRETRTLQGVGTPQFYMNYGNYYSGYGQ